MTSIQLATISRWASPENRRREGLRAAHQQDAEALIELTHSYIRLKSGKRGRTSALTLKTYGESIRKFLNFTGPASAPAHALNQLTLEVFELWLLHLQNENNLSISTVKRHLYGVRNLIKALVWANVLDSDLTQGLVPPIETTPPHARKKPLTRTQLRGLLELPQQNHPDAPTQARRDQLLLLLGSILGLRAAELVGLNTNDIDLAGLNLTVRGKGNKTRLVPLTPRVVQAITDWLALRRGVTSTGESALLVSLSRATYGQRLSTDGARYIAENYYKALGLSPDLWGLHTLRRTAGTQLYRATRDLHVVADLLGHASINTAAIYARMDMDVRREALEKLEAQDAGEAG